MDVDNQPAVLRCQNDAGLDHYGRGGVAAVARVLASMLAISRRHSGRNDCVHDPVDAARDDDGPTDADLLASPLPSKSASIFRAREAGTRAFNMRFSWPGTILGAVVPRRVKALGYALLHAHRFHRHDPRGEPKLGQHRPLYGKHI